MLRRTALIFLLSILAARAEGASDDASVNLAGIGTKSCSYWLAGRAHRSEGAVWIYGFWSGLNYVAVASEQKQSNATSSEMIAAVEKLCRRDPTDLLASAVWSAYIDSSKN
jgi:hypothetical protein